MNELLVMTPPSKDLFLISHLPSLDISQYYSSVIIRHGFSI